MTLAAQSAAEQPISKTVFAQRRGVSQGRVTQWISEKKIKAPALVGEGRKAQIVESLAVEQLGHTLDVGQRFGNGLATRLTVDVPPSGAAPGLPLTTAKPADDVADQIAREKLEQIQRANRREAMDEAADAGRLTDAAAFAQAAGRNAAQMVSVFEGALPELASAIASKFELVQRDVLHLLRGEFRKVRANAAAVARQQAQAMPALVPFEIEAEQPADDGTDIERGTGRDGSDGEGVGAAATG